MCYTNQSIVHCRPEKHFHSETTNAPREHVLSMNSGTSAVPVANSIPLPLTTTRVCFRHRARFLISARTAKCGQNRRAVGGL